MHFNEDKKHRAIKNEKLRLAKIRLEGEEKFLKELKEVRLCQSVFSVVGEDGSGYDARGYAGDDSSSFVSDSTATTATTMTTTTLCYKVRRKTTIGEKIRGYKWAVVKGKLEKVPMAAASVAGSVGEVVEKAVENENVEQEQEQEQESVVDDITVETVETPQTVQTNLSFSESSSILPSLSTFDLTIAEESEGGSYFVEERDMSEAVDDDVSFASLSDDDTVEIVNSNFNNINNNNNAAEIPKTHISIYGQEVDDFFRATSPTSFKDHMNRITERPASPSIPHLFLSHGPG